MYKSTLYCFFAAMLFVVINTTSCVSTKKVIYFNDFTDSTASALKDAQNTFQNAIQKNDQLWITVGGSNPTDLIGLNSGNGFGASGSGGSIGSGNNGPILGYLVESDGKIQVPYIGRVQAEGLTRMQLETRLTDLFKDYTKNPIVNVRFLNYQFSVLGEVLRSGRYSMPTERTTILEAISMAGDITELGRRDNVTVIREENGQRTFTKVNLLSKNLFTSPVFYLRTNDVIYIEPVKARFISRTGIPQYLSIVAVGISLVITLLNLRNR